MRSCGFWTSIFGWFVLGGLLMDAGGWWKNNGKNRGVFLWMRRCAPKNFPCKKTEVVLFPLDWYIHIYIYIYICKCIVCTGFYFAQWQNDSQQRLGTLNFNELYHNVPSLDFFLSISNHHKLNSEIRWLLRPRWVMDEMPHNGCSHWRQPSGRPRNFGASGGNPLVIAFKVLLERNCKDQYIIGIGVKDF